MNTATYSPEDNKLRLYVGRVPRDEYLKLKAEGWTSTPKQSCDFVATWTPGRRNTCLEYADLIEDEDQSPEDRAADRAERFSGYLDKRLGEAGALADKFESGPSSFGFQSQAKADRTASRHDRIAGHACDAWSKAEYWQQRTAGVIAHALYSSRPDVRMGRIKTIEAELRALESNYTPNESAGEIMQTGKDGTQVPFVWAGHSRGGYWVEKSRLDAIRQGSEEWRQHLAFRIAYENQMLEAQGGRAAFVEMEVGGWVGSHQIRKVNKSNATGRVVSVAVAVTSNLDKWGNKLEGGPKTRMQVITVERMSSDIYRAPSDEDRAALVAQKKAEKASAPKVEACPLINPTDEDAERLQAIWNTLKSISYEREPAKVLRITQAQYSANSKGSYARVEAKFLSPGGKEPRSRYGQQLENAICKVRFSSYAVIIITDKPQKPLPPELFNDPTEARLAIVQDQARELMTIDTLLRGSMKNTGDLITPEQRELFTLARLVGYAYEDSLSQRGTTPKFYEWAKANGLYATA